MRREKLPDLIYSNPDHQKTHVHKSVSAHRAQHRSTEETKGRILHTLHVWELLLLPKVQCNLEDGHPEALLDAVKILEKLLPLFTCSKGLG